MSTLLSWMTPDRLPLLVAAAALLIIALWAWAWWCGEWRARRREHAELGEAEPLHDLATDHSDPDSNVWLIDAGAATWQLYPPGSARWAPGVANPLELGLIAAEHDADAGRVVDGFDPSRHRHGLTAALRPLGSVEPPTLAELYVWVAPWFHQVTGYPAAGIQHGWTPPYGLPDEMDELTSDYVIFVRAASTGSAAADPPSRYIPSSPLRDEDARVDPDTRPGDLSVLAGLAGLVADSTAATAGPRRVPTTTLPSTGRCSQNLPGCTGVGVRMQDPRVQSKVSLRFLCEQCAAALDMDA